jgi:hypothetical protein
MNLNYTMTAEDLREVTDFRNPVKKSRNRFTAFLGWLFIFGLTVLMAVYHPWSDTFQFVNGRIVAIEHPQQNLWVTLIPSLIVTTFLVMAMAFPKTAPAKKGVGGRLLNAVIKRRNALCFIWVLPLLIPQLEIDWAPTDRQAVWAAFVPWALYSGVVGLLLSVRKATVVDKTWNKHPSLHRPAHTVVNDDGLDKDDGVVRHVYRWPHFKRYDETENLFVLTTEDGLSVWLPKRAAADEQAMDELKMLIHNNIGEGKFLGGKNAFEVVLPVIELTEE